MLELRPICENCARPLPPHALEARICSFECTFCADCAETLLLNVCPNCGGGFCPRPVRPAHEHRPGDYLGAHPASTRLRHRPVDLAEHAAVARLLGALPPHER